MKWKNALGHGFIYIEMSPILPEVSNKLKPHYLELITELGKHHHSPAWWISIISERNTAVSQLFLYCCYLEIVAKQLSKTDGKLCVVCESWALLQSIADFVKTIKWPVIWLKHPLPGQRKFLFWARIIGKITLRLLRDAIRGKLIGHHTKPPDKAKPCVFIHTYLDEACLGKDGMFHDRYFPKLTEWLENNNVSVVIIPVLFNLKRSYYSIWKFLWSCKEKFIEPYKYYHLIDYIAALKIAWKSVSMPLGRIILNGFDVTRLFDAERERYAFRGLSVLMYLSLAKRLKEAGFRIDEVIAEYENMIAEKMLILGFRSEYPSTKLVGFQHGALYPLLLCNFVTRDEAKYAPLPDRVVCNGSFFRDILIREGLPNSKAIVGPALRYAYLHKIEREPAKLGGDNTILVPLPLMVSDGVELLIKVIRAFQKEKNIRIFIKPHPMGGAERIISTSMIKTLPEHFELVQGSMVEWIRRSKVMVTLSSSSVYEALTAGMPVVVVGRETAINLNPLGFSAEFDKVFYSPDEIRKETMRLLNLTEDERIRYKDIANKLLKKSFNPVTDESMKAFIDGLVVEL